MVEITREAYETVLKSIMIDPEIAQNGGIHKIKVESNNIVFQFQVVENIPKKVFNQHVIKQIKEYENTAIAAIMNAIDVGRKSAQLTYYRFVFNILQDLNYHFIDVRGRMRFLSLNYYCSAVGQRRASLDESSVRTKKQDKDGEKNRKHYTTSDRHYRFVHLDNRNRIDDSESLRTYTTQLQPIYNDIKRVFI